MAKSMNYFEKSEMLKQAISIGEKIVLNSKLMDKNHKEAYFTFSKNITELLEHPETDFQNLKSLSYLENNFFTFWNESSGEDVELFWKFLSDNSITYQRKDIIREILKRKRIKTDHEYSIVNDGLVIAQQQGKINHEEALILNTYLSDYEKKNSSKK